MKRCKECGFVHANLDVGGVPDTWQSWGPCFQMARADADTAVISKRPEPATWLGLGGPVTFAMSSLSQGAHRAGPSAARPQALR